MNSNIMTVCIDEALLDAAGLMDFPELYAYVREREPRPSFKTAPPVPVGEQTLQEQVKINADILENSTEEFVPPEPNMPIKIDYGSKIVNKPPYVYANYDQEIIADTSLVISTTYQRQFEAQKQFNYDSNNDGKVDIMDVWNESGQGTHEAQSHVDIKKQDKLGIYKFDRAACYVRDVPFVTYSFDAKLGDNSIATICKVSYDAC
ncbi:MAG: hypothetical protein EZS28_035422 [Streblomastix strix]|uniref:Uncharacterized protein n=1 Tax=Streblomastix strix TaxID=222440 RepID=A0A5J4UGN3_9EUKA|nr:MAG: hypothetical protein EZS28_035422 [Streblomastix strix]